MATVRVELPSLLAIVFDGDDEVSAKGDTLAEALNAFRAEYPTLSVHVFDETGDLRQHVLCFHNDVNTRWLNTSDVKLDDGDTIRFYQAVSGG